MVLGRAIFSNNDDDAMPSNNESMFVVLAELGIAYDRKDMISESIENLQMAQSIGEELFDRYYRTMTTQTQEDTTTSAAGEHYARRIKASSTLSNNKTEFLTRMIVVCTILGELFDSIDKIDCAIGAYQQAAKYFDYDSMDVEHFEEMLRLMDEVGNLALEKGGGANNCCDVDDSIVEHVKSGVLLRESHVGEYNPEMISSLSILRDLYLRNGDTTNASQLTERIRVIGSRTQVQEVKDAWPSF
jgi:tetratricopeptide (TPR) repeat protein